jgi:S1-C subfamily serine protease
LQATAKAQGWVYLESRLDGPSGVESIYLAHPNEEVRQGSMTRVPVWTAYAQAAQAARGAPAAAQRLALKTLVQIDCAGQTWQALSGDAYADQAATVRVATAGVMAQAEAIKPNSFIDNLSAKVCADHPTPRAPARASVGSGVVIAPGVVLTNSHVVAHCRAIDVESAGQRWPASLRKRDAFRDMALLDTNASSDVTHVPLRTDFVLGDRVTVAGFPGSSAPALPQLAVTEGTVTALVGFASDTARFQMSAPIQPGSSGGPVLDSRGQLLGIAVAGLKDRATPALAGDLPQDTRFAIQAETLRAFLVSAGVPLRQSAAPAVLSPQALASLASAITVRVHCKV